jgi:hypothetical protein
MLGWLLACTFDAASTIKTTDTGDSGAPPVDTTETAGAADSPADTVPADPSDVDDDGDGWTENQGDCADDDEDVHPEAEDGCDGVDSDCDGEVDEDATTADAYEPNDITPYDLGSLEDEPSRALSAVLVNDADVDRFQFTIVDDLLDFFTVTATVSNIPADATFRFTLNRLRSDGDAAIGELDQVFGTSQLSLGFSDESLVEDGGDYELVVEAISGADCGRSYLLEVSQ